MFFVANYFHFSEEEYKKHEFLLVRLVHNSKKGDSITRELENNDQNNMFKRLSKDIFGAKPNSKNLRELFKIEIIWDLW